MDWSGITNENEFYSEYFMAEGLEEALSPRLRAWEVADKKSREEAEEKGEKQWKRSPAAELRAEARALYNKLEAARQEKDPVERLAAQREVTNRLLEIMGLPLSAEPAQDFRPLGDDHLPLPLIGKLMPKGGAPESALWIFEAFDPSSSPESDSETDILSLKVSTLQIPKVAITSKMNSEIEQDWLGLMDKHVFSADEPPRWVILAGASSWVLLDRMKYGRKALICFHWKELLSRRLDRELAVCAGLLSLASFADTDDRPLLDVIEEKANQQAYGVSESLKKSLRRSIELLGNEAAAQICATDREQKRKMQARTPAFAAQLSTECLRYMYRLLFLFYVESRPELKYAPVTSKSYMTSYSIESLRDLELVPLITEEDRKGRYIHDSITQLMGFFSEGTPDFREKEKAEVNTDEKKPAAGELFDGEDIGLKDAEAFSISPLFGSLFDPSRTRLLNNVVFTNETLQSVIRMMSLSQGEKGRRFRTGRISYAHLGVNQLGAVYEALLSYSGFFATEDLYEVHPEGVTPSEFDAAYFVTKSELVNYKDSEKTYVTNEIGEKTLKVYPKETFIYRLTGRAREKSASYYTPEVLTECVVKYALKEYFETVIDKLPDDAAKAEKIRTLKICEPAMGSAAFLNEAINQLADKYMHHAQAAKHERLDPARYREEVQRVRMYLADNCVYGVDLNPIAVELGEVSLWLNALSVDRFVPWFGLQLQCGNSLIGCRRRVYQRHDVLTMDWEHYGPTDIGSRERKKGEFWQFLMPDPDMAGYNDPDVKNVFSKQFDTLKKQRRRFCRTVYSVDDANMLEELSAKAETLWQNWAKKLHELRQKTSDPYPIYGFTPDSKKLTTLSYADKRSLVESYRRGNGSAESGEYSRLQLAMNYWTSLWFWPIEKAEQFPSRDEFFSEMMLILSSEVLNTASGVEPSQGDLFAASDTEQPSQVSEDLSGRLDMTDLMALYPRFRIVNELAKRYRFFHWPLDFADIFLPQEKEAEAGFDLTFGNPPWRVPAWNSGEVIGDALPYVLFQKMSASSIQEMINSVDASGDSFAKRHEDLIKSLAWEYEETAGTQIFLKSTRNYPECNKSALDLFKFFLPLSWRNSSEHGVQGFLHPLTTFTETKAVSLRKRSYLRLRCLFQFVNELSLFNEVHHNTEFAVCVYGPIQFDDKKEPLIKAQAIMNLFEPHTIDETYSSDGSGDIQGIKTNEGKWNVKGHSSRLIDIDNSSLKTIAEIFNGGTSDSPILPNIHCRELLNILKKFSMMQNRIRAMGKELSISPMWHETGSRKDGTIREFADLETYTANKTHELILNGPHLSVGNPLFKTPKFVCRSNLDWKVIDLELINDNFLPRVKYEPACSTDEYKARQVECPWDEKFFNAHWMLAYREMVSVDLERTLTVGLYPPETAWVNTIHGIATEDEFYLLNIACSFASLPMDAFVRQMGKGHLQPSLIKGLPLIDYGTRTSAAHLRILTLNCLTKWYGDLWSKHFYDDYCDDKWTQEHEGLDPDWFSGLTQEWQRTNALRSDLARRQALLEIDVLTAQAIGLTLDELLTLYRLRFRVMRDYDQNTWYDQKGRIVFTTNRGLVGVGLPRKAVPKDWEAGIRYAVDDKPCDYKGLGFDTVREKKSGQVTKTFPDDTMSETPQMTTVSYEAPFFRMDREADYRRAWAAFEERFREDKDEAPTEPAAVETSEKNDEEKN